MQLLHRMMPCMLCCRQVHEASQHQEVDEQQLQHTHAQLAVQLPSSTISLPSMLRAHSCLESFCCLLRRKVLCMRCSMMYMRMVGMRKPTSSCSACMRTRQRHCASAAKHIGHSTCGRRQDSAMSKHCSGTCSRMRTCRCKHPSVEE